MVISPRLEARREELVDAALAVIRRDGADASMEAIAAEAGVTKPILYRHLGDRNGLCQAIADRVFGQILEGTVKAFKRNPPGPGLVGAAMDVYLAFLEKDTNVYRFLRKSDLDNTGAYNVGRDFAGALTRSLSVYGFDPEAAQTWGHGMVGMVEAAGQWWLEERPISRRKLVEHLSTLLWDGFERIGSRNA